ncbi:HNH endonuclease [Sorangium sp. So ce590]|uniref:HNH endonuclease n=1 Tax=unclassified Sorangium TaxID=2621164 RepID=UPI003F5EC346
MNVNEVASILGVSKEQAILAIEEGVETPRTRTRVRLPAVELPHGFDIAQEHLEAFIATFEQEEPGRHPPIGVRRALLLESGYKCAVCLDSAPLEFHHILEWAKLQHHDPEHMLTVCANCHSKITRYSSPDVVAQKQIKGKLRARREGEASLIVVQSTPATSTPLNATSKDPEPRTDTAAWSDFSFDDAPEPELVQAVAITPNAASPQFEPLMRQIFSREITYSGPNSEELEWLGALLFAKIPRVDVSEHCITLLRVVRTITQIQHILYPEAHGTDWIDVDRLKEATANVLAEGDADLSRLSDFTDSAISAVRSRMFLQFRDVDRWHPGMASGSGWVEEAALSLIGSKILKKTDPPESKT